MHDGGGEKATPELMSAAAQQGTGKRGSRLGPTFDAEQALPHHREVGDLGEQKPDR
jgi:hypothetical protein